MGKKGTTVFVCQECGYESAKWAGQCICGAWNTMREERVLPADENDKRRRIPEGKASRAVRLDQVRSGDFDRIDTGIGELNRVLGGGLVRGSLTLISGEPGIGKSTLIIQAAAEIAQKAGTVLYITGEESEEQVKMRADRVCPRLPENLFLLAETNMEQILKVVEETKPEFLVIDSIQTMYSSELESAPGSVSQIRDCAALLMKVGKGRSIPVFIVAHVTKSGELAGPKIIEHLVDCVLQFTGERDRDLRILRSLKNRFGTTSEIGAFEMEQEGLISVENLSESFLEGMENGEEGSVATAVYEGTRPLLLEIQALTSPCGIGFARRTCLGVDSSRLNMILAVLERRAGLSLVNQDVYVNVVGGLRPEGTYTDLAVALAVYSSFMSCLPRERILAVGEIGLTGELRSVQNAEKIVGEALRMGFKKIIIPAKNKTKLTKLPDGGTVIGAASLKEAIAIFSE